MDHKNGNAANNELDNLIRHCGFHGIKDHLILAHSKLSQLEIVTETRRLYLLQLQQLHDQQQQERPS